MVDSKWVVLTEGVGGRTIGRARVTENGLGPVTIEATVNDVDMCLKLQAGVSYLSIEPSANALKAGITSVTRVSKDYGTLGVQAMAEAIEEGSRFSKIYDPDYATRHVTRHISDVDEEVVVFRDHTQAAATGAYYGRLARGYELAGKPEERMDALRAFEAIVTTSAPAFANAARGGFHMAYNGVED